EHQRELKRLKEKAKREAKARAELKARQERERLARSNPSAAENKAYGKKMNALKGWSRCWPSLLILRERERNWNERAEHPPSGAHTQIAWGPGYSKARYKDPCGAWAFWQRNNWY